MCLALVEAMIRHGIPEELLTDMGESSRTGSAKAVRCSSTGSAGTIRPTRGHFALVAQVPVSVLSPLARARSSRQKRNAEPDHFCIREECTILIPICSQSKGRYLNAAYVQVIVGQMTCLYSRWSK